MWASLEITVGLDWAKFRPFGNFFQKVYLVFGKMEIPLCQNGDSVLANFYSFWAKVYCCKRPTIEKIIWLRLWSHWTSTFPLSIFLLFSFNLSTIFMPLFVCLLSLLTTSFLQLRLLYLSLHIFNAVSALLFLFLIY